MKIMRVFVLSMVFLALGLVGGKAFASCTVSGKVWKGYAVSSGTSDYGYFYIKPFANGLPTYGWYVYASYLDSLSVQALNSALSSGKSVIVQGNVSACPTTGTARYIGVVDYVQLVDGY